jgi:arabinose-5-phosphate isomerase
MTASPHSDLDMDNNTGHAVSADPTGRPATDALRAESGQFALKNKILFSARRVLEIEVQGLEALSDTLNGAFITAVELMQGAKGRIVVSGMGKSGHIGHKIAATLASTGSPSFFVHPGEASHGDLGMITTDDVVLAISNSGETSELSDLVAYTRRFNIPLVGITSRAESTLAKAADAGIILPNVKEACSIGLAPTTSTTMTLAVGDCLAMALLDLKGFDADDFRMYHPGGKLGARLLKVGSIMHAGDKMPLVAHDQTMAQALLEMTAKSFGCIGVLDAKGTLVGVVTDGDLRRHMSDTLLARPVAEIMTANPVTVSNTMMAAEALRRMNEMKITSLFAVDAHGVPQGILHVHDCLRAGVV